MMVVEREQTAQMMSGIVVIRCQRCCFFVFVCVCVCVCFVVVVFKTLLKCIAIIKPNV